MDYKKPVIGIMGPGQISSPEDQTIAFDAGKIIAEQGFHLLTGGRNVGVMHHASRGAKQAGGMVLGILPGDDEKDTSEFVDIPIYTGMGQARNIINVLSCSIIVVIGQGPGTLSEIVLAIKYNKPIILYKPSDKLREYLETFKVTQINIIRNLETLGKLMHSLLS